MQRNVDGCDRIARLVLGPVPGTVSLVALAGYLSSAIGPLSTGVVAALFGIISLVFIVTGLAQKCPLNRALGIDTNRSERAAGTAETPRERKVA